MPSIQGTTKKYIAIMRKKTINTSVLLISNVHSEPNLAIYSYTEEL